MGSNAAGFKLLPIWNCRYFKKIKRKDIFKLCRSTIKVHICISRDIRIWFMFDFALVRSEA